MVKIPTVGAHHGAYRRDNRASLKDLFIKIIHSMRRINSEFKIGSLSGDYINLDYSARLQLAPHHP
jgi:hypothetical protein